MTQPASSTSLLRAALQGSALPAPAPQVPVDSVAPADVPVSPVTPPPSPASAPTSPVPTPTYTPVSQLPQPPSGLLDEPSVPAPSTDAAQPVVPSPDAALPAAPVSDDASPTDSPAAADPAAQKSPLEVLEEILAGADAEKAAKEDAENRAAKEAQAAADLLQSKYQAFSEEAAVKMEQQKVALAEATQQRDKVEEDLRQQGKQDESVPTAVGPLAIHQLTHDISEVG